MSDIYPVGPNQKNATSDPFYASLPVNAEVDFYGGAPITNTQTLQGRDGVKIKSITTPPPPPPPPPALPVEIITHDAKNPSRSIDGIRFPSGVKGASVDGQIYNTQGKGSSAVSDSGTNSQISNITNAGIGRVLTCSGAVGGTADMLVDTAGQAQDYNIWGGVTGSALGPSNYKITRFDLAMAMGMHSVRFHKYAGVTLGDPTLSLPGLPAFAGRITYTSAYRGAAATWKEGSGAKMIRLLIIGPVGYGPNNVEGPTSSNPAGNPGWEKLRTTDALVSGCEIHTLDRFFALNPGTDGLRVEKSKIIADTGFACLDVNAPWLVWPAAANIVFDTVDFAGSTLCTSASLPYLAGLTFTNCTFNGKLFTKVDPKTGAVS